MKRMWIYIGVLVSAVILFFALVKYEDRSVVRTLDFAATVKIQERVDKSSRLRLADLVENIMEGATFFASPEFTVVATLTLTGVAIYITRKRKWGMSALVIPVALLVVVLVEIYIKTTVHHPSPPFSMIKNPTTMFAMDYINEQFSFPSGHAARAMFLACVTYIVLLISNKKLRYIVILPFLLVYVSLVSISLIYLGHHWLSDVVGGLLIGTGCGVVVMLMLRQASNNEVRLDSKHLRDEKME